MKWCMMVWVWTLLSACTKEQIVREPWPIIPRPIGPVTPVKPVKLIWWPHVLPPAEQCIGSWEELVAALGGSAKAVTSVVLDDGTTVAVGGAIVSMTYSTVNEQNASSLFHSQLLVQHNTYGYLQSHYQDVWSLGCPYAQAGVPPFTQVIWNNRIWLVNTCFTWGVPPLGVEGHRVKYVIMD